MNDAKEEIKARLAIEDVIGQYVELKRSGRNLKGHSPWGTDKTPSFMVSPDKNIWHDFSSNRGGDVFSFVMEIEGLNFREALEKLAAKAGVELDKYAGGDAKVTAHRKRLKDCLELATKYYQVCLTKNKPVMEYVFYRRNLNKKTVEKFRIGYAPMEGRALTGFLKKRGFTDKELADAGVVNRFGGDLFKGRMMVPLMDGTGGVIGFTGRILDDTDKNAPKYLNTPETMLYNKGRHIFGLSQAKEAIRKSQYAVVVEGNMDVISSHQAGVAEAVATAGTAMTEMHIKAMSRLTDDIRLAYDGDEAGVNAAERAIGIASRLGIYLSVVDDYQGCKDADELIQKDPNLWQKAIAKHQPAVEWLLSKYEDKYDLRSERGFKEYSDMAKRLVVEIADITVRERYERMVADKLGISLESFRQKEVEGVKRQLKKIVQVADVPDSGPSVAVKSLGALRKYGGVELGQAGGDSLREPLELPEMDEGELSLIFEEKYQGWGEDKIMKEAEELARKIKREQREARGKALQEEIEEAHKSGDSEREDRLFKEFYELKKERD
jgi:DNA primase